MGHLYDELGSRYITDFFGGAYLLHEGAVHRLNEAYHDKVRTETIEYTDNNPDKLQVDAGLLSDRTIESFSKFSWPKLGYRNLKLHDGLIACTYLQSVRSTTRGLREECLLNSYDHATSMVISGADDYINKTYVMYNVFKPQWYSYKEAMTMLREGKACSVALSEDVAITHNTSGGSALYEVRFRDKVVAAIEANGMFTYSNKVVLKMKMFNKLFDRSF